ncbi:MAG: hypothetical protein ACI83N_001792 [Hydrogenophaga sp.]|jgi:hypothetical protein
MKIPSRNHSPTAALHSTNVFSLRSLWAFQGLSAIPGWRSSSSLLFSFAPGRFAVFCLSGRV